VGFRLDADGYRVVLDGMASQQVRLQDTVVFAAVSAVPHTVALTGAAANCDAEDGALQKALLVEANLTAEVAFPIRCGILIAVDEAHHNFHTISGRYHTFARFLRAHDYVVKPARWSVQPDSLALTDVLVIANALAVENVDRWVLPTPPAFSDEEIANLRSWVEEGGRLFLIADHMPFGGAAERLAAAFGVRLRNGFAWDPTQIAFPRDCLAAHEIQVFRRSDGSLADHPVTQGPTAAERVDSVGTFTGHAFEPDSVTEPLLIFGSNAVQYYPTRSWEFAGAAFENVSGWRQAALRRLGKGRVAIFGDGTMFFDKLCEPNNEPNGMNHPVAAQNGLLLLNTLKWLLGEIGS
jgi:hypothetical protein